MRNISKICIHYMIKIILIQVCIKEKFKSFIIINFMYTLMYLLTRTGIVFFMNI